MATHTNTQPNAHLVIVIQIKNQQILRLFDAQVLQFLQLILSKGDISIAINIEVAKDHVELLKRCPLA